MARAYRQRPGDVIARRISTAAVPAKPPAGGSGSEARAMALLTIVPAGHEQPAASRAVARYLSRTGCRGRKCGYGEHAGHLALRDELMGALGLAGGDL